MGVINFWGTNVCLTSSICLSACIKWEVRNKPLLAREGYYWNVSIIYLFSYMLYIIYCIKFSDMRMTIFKTSFDCFPNFMRDNYWPMCTDVNWRLVYMIIQVSPVLYILPAWCSLTKCRRYLSDLFSTGVKGLWDNMWMWVHDEITQTVHGRYQFDP